MRIHNPFVTGSLTVSGSKAVDFTDATKGVSGSFSGSFEGRFDGSFNSSDVKDSLPSGTVSSSAQLATDISGSFAQASSSLETNKASKGFAIAMSVAL